MIPSALYPADSAALLELARVAQGGAALAHTITRALESPSFFAFSEMLELPSVAGLRASTAVARLELYAHGSLAEYRTAPPATYGSLSDAGLAKLRMVSLHGLALGEGARSLPYDALRLAVDVERDEALEALLISCVYAGMFTCKMDQRRRVCEVASAVGRSVLQGDVPALVSRLEIWRASIGVAQAALTEQRGAVSATVRHEMGFSIDFEAKLKEALVGSEAGAGHAAMSDDEEGGMLAMLGYSGEARDEAMDDEEDDGRPGAGRPRQRPTKRRTGPAGMPVPLARSSGERSAAGSATSAGSVHHRS
jgi:hypothetical protein